MNACILCLFNKRWRFLNDCGTYNIMKPFFLLKGCMTKTILMATVQCINKSPLLKWLFGILPKTCFLIFQRNYRMYSKVNIKKIILKFIYKIYKSEPRYLYKTTQLLIQFSFIRRKTIHRTKKYLGYPKEKQGAIKSLWTPPPTSVWKYFFSFLETTKK